MMDVFSPKKRSEVMRAIRSKDTKPELAIRKALGQAWNQVRTQLRKEVKTPTRQRVQNQVLVWGVTLAFAISAMAFCAALLTP